MSSKLYNTPAWHRLRASQLRYEPYCCRCAALGRSAVASVADHINPHKGNEALFLDPDNLQSLCITCHNSYKRRLEMSGKVAGCTADGVPLDPKHHWFK